MDEFDFYEIKQWGFPEWFGDGYCPELTSNLFIYLSHNPHFMAANILYANFEKLEKNFATWFDLTKNTVFLYNKIKAKYIEEVIYNQHTEAKYFHFTRTPGLEFKERWKYRTTVSRMCETQPLHEIFSTGEPIIPYEDIDWYFLARNPYKCVIDFMKRHPQNINWARLSGNSSDAAVDYLLEQPHNIDWWSASKNTNEKIIAHFNANKNKLSEYKLSENSSDMAVRFLLNTEGVTTSWTPFCKNPSDVAVSHIIDIISQNRDDIRIVWTALCGNENPRVLDILRDNKDKIVWKSFVKNPICFSYNYEMMRKRCLPIKKEIEEIFLRPDNVMAMIERYRNGDEEDFDVISRLNM